MGCTEARSQAAPKNYQRRRAVGHRSRRCRPTWIVQGEQERDHLGTLLSPWLIARIEHVGSTAIPDLNCTHRCGSRCSDVRDSCAIGRTVEAGPNGRTARSPNVIDIEGKCRVRTAGVSLRMSAFGGSPLIEGRDVSTGHVFRISRESYELRTSAEVCRHRWHPLIPPASATARLIEPGCTPGCFAPQ